MKKKIRIVAFNHRKGMILLSNLSERAVEALLKMVEGTIWTRANKTRTNFEEVQTYNDLPNPTVDDALEPFWSKFDPPAGQGIQPSLFYAPVDPGETLIKPSVFIRGLCNGEYTTPEYKRQVGTMKKFGFIQLRTQRKANGKFIELWYLPSLHHAEGMLKVALQRTLDARANNIALDVLYLTLEEYVSFTSFEITYRYHGWSVGERTA